MFLNELHLTNYRNYDELTMQFLSEFTIIEAPNASGKSNLLEAIAMLSYPRPVRDVSDGDLINWEAKDRWMRIEGRYDSTRTAEIFVQRNNGSGTSKVLKVNGNKVKSTQFIGNVYVILFSITVLSILSLTPSKRRAFLDRSLAILYPEYLLYMIEYEKVVRNRNKILQGIKKGLNQRDELAFWDVQLKDLGVFIINKRKDFIQKVNGTLQEFPYMKFPLQVDYEPIFSFDTYLPIQREIEAGMTLVGPHREDWKLMSGERNIGVFGSRGEQRMGILYFQFSLYKIIEKLKQIKSILLLDDLNSELDKENLHILIRTIEELKGQSIVTTTNHALYTHKNAAVQYLSL